MYNKTEIGRIAQQHGFVRDTFEKVLHLKDVLNYLNEEEYLRDHLLLKGGTAINLAVFNLPRLSVDIEMQRMFFISAILGSRWARGWGDESSSVSGRQQGSKSAVCQD